MTTMQCPNYGKICDRYSWQIFLTITLLVLKKYSCKDMTLNGISFIRVKNKRE